MFLNCFSLAARTSSHTVPCNSGIFSMRVSTSANAGKNLLSKTYANSFKVIAGFSDSDWLRIDREPLWRTVPINGSRPSTNHSN